MATKQHTLFHRPLYLTVAIIWGILALASAAQAGGAGGLRVVVAGQHIQGPPAPYLEGNIIYGPVAECAQAMGLEVDWQPNTGRLGIIKGDGVRVRLVSGERLFWCGEEKLPLDGEADVRQKLLVAPLRPVLEALGAVVHQDKSNNYLSANISVQEPIVRGDEAGLAVLIKANAQVTAGEVKYLDDPPRAYVDLPGAQCQPRAGRRYLGRNGLWRLRWGQVSAQPPVARFVLDLQAEQEIRWMPHPKGYGGALIVGQFDGDEPILEPCTPQLQAINARQDGANATIIEIDFSLPVQWSYSVTRQPGLVKFNIRDAELPKGPLRQAIDSDFVRGMEAAAESDGVGVKVHLKELIGFHTTGSEEPMQIRLTFRRRQLAEQTVVIDPGHGGKDKGAQGRELLEKDVNLDVAKRLLKQLMARDVCALMTRDTDVFVDLFARPLMAEEVQAAALVSIHCNAMPRPDTNWGTETYYYTPQSKILAIILHQHLLAALGRKDNGVRKARFVVVRETQVPAVLVELMYLNHCEEEQLLAQSEVRQAAAEAIVAGLQQYFEGEATMAAVDRRKPHLAHETDKESSQ